MVSGEQMNDIAIDIRSVSKRFGDVAALDKISLGILDNEFFTLLGPSGCGKTTLLRCIAGFEDVSEGEIVLYGENIAELPPNKRPVNTVFQHYALFPHMSVTQNVMFGLLRLGMDKAVAQKRVNEVLELVQLTSLAQRLPSQMSGGQQQRVALARALAPNPKVLLLDEPLSALDLKLRQAVRLELQQIQHETGITFVFVTHDQEEALTMSDRIAVINEGELQQVGTAQEIYEAPKNKFVAGFIGETNLIDVKVNSISDERAECMLSNGVTIFCPSSIGALTGAGHLSLRPERLNIVAPKHGLLRGKVSRHIYLGTDLHVDLALEDKTTITVRIQNSHSTPIPAIGDDVGINFEADAARLLVD